MPQASILSGNPTLEGRQNPLIGNELVSMAEAFTRVKQAETAQAMQKYQTMIQNMQVLPTSATELRKVAKKAGMPLPSDDEIAAIAQVGKTERGGQAPNQPQKPAAQGAQKSGQQNSDAAAVAAQKKFQENMTPQQGLQHLVNSIYAKGMANTDVQYKAQMADANARQARAGAEAALDQNRKLILDPSTDKKTRAEALGRLYLGSGTKLDINTLAFVNGSDEQKEHMLNLSRGEMSPVERAKLTSDMVPTLVQGGASLSDSLKAAQSWVDGKPLPPELDKALGQPSFLQLYKQSQFAESLSSLGLKGSELTGASECAMRTGNVLACLPPNFQTAAQAQLKMEKAHIGVMESQASTASKREGAYEKAVTGQINARNQKNQAALYKLMLDQTNHENDNYFKALNAVTTANRYGTPVDPKQLQQVLDGLKTTYNVDDPQEFLNRLSGKAPTTTAPSGNPVDQELGGPQK